MKFKVCGLNKYENIYAVEALPEVSHTGFIFVSASPRNAFNLATLPKKNATVKRLGVFVNPSLETIQHYFEAFELDFIQLHGEESPEFCELVEEKIAPVFKAIGIKNVEDIASLSSYNGAVSAFVFDTKSSRRGGTGKKFDWSILDNYKLNIPFLLSGGISPEDTKQLSNFFNPMCIGYDLNSRFEKEPGIKDCDLLTSFITNLSVQKTHQKIENH